MKQVFFAIKVVFEFLDFFEELTFSGLLVDHLFAFNLGGYQGLGVDGVTFPLQEFDSLKKDVLLLLELFHYLRNLVLGSILRLRLVIVELSNQCLLLRLMNVLLNHFLVNLVSLLNIRNFLHEVFVLSLKIRDLEKELLGLSSNMVRWWMVASQTSREDIAD